MPADEPTILATSAGFRAGSRTKAELNELVEYAIDLSGVDGRSPKVCFLATAIGGAGSICWHVGGTTDSYGPRLRPVTDGRACAVSNGVHYDAEPQRRPLFEQLVAHGTLPAGYATDDGVGLLYRGTQFAEALTERPGKGAYFVD